jgi:hypothetical protein
MVKITITPQAFAALAATLPLGSVAVEPERAPDGSVGIWLDHATLAKLKAMRSPSAGGGSRGAVNASRGFARLVYV